MFESGAYLMMDTLAQGLPPVVQKTGAILLVVFGFSVVVFFHELGHFIVAKWAGVRVDKFCVGFGRELFGFTRGETRYCFNILPVGGYVKMLGQEDFDVDKSGEWAVRNDPRSFSNKPVGARAAVVSAGVAMNLVFAAAAFAVVYMIGLDSISPVVGYVAPGNPASLAGVQEGDRIVRMGRSSIRSYQDIKMATVLAEPHEPITVEVLRNGKPWTTRITPQVNQGDGLLWLGIGPGFTNRLMSSSPYLNVAGAEALAPGDEILAINAKETGGFMELWTAMVESGGKPINLRVARPENPNIADGPSEELDVQCRVPLDFQPGSWAGQSSKHFMGLVPRRQIVEVLPGSRAELAGFEEGDVVARWHGIDNPTYAEIVASIETNPEADLRARVLRDGGLVDVVVRPKVSGRWYKRGKAKVGLGFQGLEEGVVTRDGATGLLVADVWPELDSYTLPAADLVRSLDEPDAPEPMVRGALIEAVDGEPVRGWYELVTDFRRKAEELARQGRDVGPVAITYRNPGGTSQTRQMRLPTSLRTATHLPPSAVIISIDGARWVTVRDPQGREREVSASHWMGARELLSRRVGQTVEVSYYVFGADGEEQTTSFQVTENNVDPWLTRMNYATALSLLMPFPQREPLRVSNPLAGIWMGVKETAYIILQVYTTMERMIFTRTVGMDNISGPVGIVKLGSDIAESDMNRLLWFLAMISANLAVINFLPLPIVDGGLMVFLIIEKIKGQPVSLKTQVVTQVIGLALIIGIFVFVTVLDLSKL